LLDMLFMSNQHNLCSVRGDPGNESAILAKLDQPI